MGMKFKLIFSRAAASDLNETFEYISHVLKAPKAATELMNKLDTTINLLSEQPYMCPLCNDNNLQILGYRKMIIDKYVVIYQVDEQNMIIYVLRVFFGATNYGKYIN